jgi:hypothetical protein
MQSKWYVEGNAYSHIAPFASKSPIFGQYGGEQHLARGHLEKRGHLNGLKMAGVLDVPSRKRNQTKRKRHGGRV